MDDFTLEHHSIHHLNLADEVLVKPTVPTEESDIETFGKDVLQVHIPAHHEQ